jgi:hypothetical protein
MTAAFELAQILGPIAVASLLKAVGGFAPALMFASGLLALSAFALGKAASENPSR